VIAIKTLREFRDFFITTSDNRLPICVSENVSRSSLDPLEESMEVV
jgi:hypothetical protein